MKQLKLDPTLHPDVEYTHPVDAELGGEENNGRDFVNEDLFDENNEDLFDENNEDLLVEQNQDTNNNGMASGATKRQRRNPSDLTGKFLRGIRGSISQSGRIRK